MRKARPELLVLIETELWPNMLHSARQAGCRVVLANARLSERSAAGYARFAGSTRAMLSALNHIAAQSEADAQRFIDLGMNPDRVAVSGSIKFDVSLDENLRTQAEDLRGRWQIAERPVFLVASTHRGEDEVALDALTIVQNRMPNVLLLIAPRHPERFEEVYSLCVSRGLAVCRRSAGEDPGSQTQVLLIDTLGELLMLFGLAQVAVIGGSFVPNGGHNPLEAAVWGMPVICGPSMFNFEDIAERLQAAGALEQVENASALAGALVGLLGDPEERNRRGACALEVMEQSRGALDALVAAVLRVQGEV
jgi:3-deoxy-D-manno-octulosonic-acid transferase